MNNLIKKIQKQETRDLTYMYSKEHNIPEDEIIFSMANLFIGYLPYSMDIKQKEYVPADFINMTPYDVNNHKTFWEDYKNVYDGMIKFGETFSSGILVQISAVFQKMLSGQFPNDYQLEESDFFSWGINEMTNDKAYNEKFFNILKGLPEYYKKVQETKTNEDRRKALMDAYMSIQQDIGNKVGGYKKTNEQGEVVEEDRAMVMLHPSFDLEMLYDSYYIRTSSKNVVDLKRMLIKKEVDNINSNRKKQIGLEDSEIIHEQ
ncbi:MAG: hypothetical protein HFJ26_09370 [Clostridia bacterium]|nr:hypothetical protein [Clostridia bacterium]